MGCSGEVRLWGVTLCNRYNEQTSLLFTEWSININIIIPSAAISYGFTPSTVYTFSRLAGYTPSTGYILSMLAGYIPSTVYTVSS